MQHNECISLRVRVVVSCCLISLFFFLSEKCYASEQQVLKQTVETPADKTTVRGRVVDTKGEPLIGATVREKGGANGTVTDVDGNFFLSVPDSAVAMRQQKSRWQAESCLKSPFRRVP